MSGGKAGKGGAGLTLARRRLPQRPCTVAADPPTNVKSIRGGWEPPRVIARHPGSPRFFPRERGRSRSATLPIMTASQTRSGAGLEMHAPLEPGFAEILTAEARRFLTTLARACEPRRQQLLGRRGERQPRLEAGEPPHLPPATRPGRGAAGDVPPDPPRPAGRPGEDPGALG